MTSNDRARVPTTAELDTAWGVVRGRLAVTPVVPTSLPHNAMLKLESFQPTGSFKIRGALAAMNSLEPGQHAVTASAGNHGLGMAFAAVAFDRQATVVVAKNASPAKVTALRALPIHVVQHGTSYDDAEHRAVDLARDGGVYVSAYNDADVIAGQSTIAREVDEQVAGPITMVCGVGGGGLCAGLSLWADARDDIDVIGVEAEVSRAVSASIDAGHTVEVPVGETLADGLAGNVDDPCVTLDIIGRHARGLVSVTEEEIGTAMRWLFRQHGLVVEGAGAVGIAAALAGKLSVPPRRTLVFILTGRNITAQRYREVLADGR